MFHPDRMTRRSAPAPARRRIGRLILSAALAVLALGACGAGALAYLDPAVVPAAVDDVRAAVGPGPIAAVESLVFQAQDKARQARYRATGTTRHIEWAAPPLVAAAPATAPRPRHSAPQRRVKDQLADIQRPQPEITSGIAWSPFVSTPAGQPVLERALVAPDPARPYVETALVRIDLRAARLHLVAGTQEPASRVRIPRPGVIPAADRTAGQLLAAFNGGFKAANGDFGMGVNGTTLLPPIDGLATLAIYRDGHVAMGAWGKDITAAPGLIDFRQNCPLLLDGGTPTEAAASDSPAQWGRTVGNKIATWRSGLGLSADGRYLIYAAGDSLTVPALAQALADGGADRAMQLDINSWWTRFVTYAPAAGGRLAAQKLLTDMAGDSRQFLVPDTRDFFYITAG